jgi:hypothetical protein
MRGSSGNNLREFTSRSRTPTHPIELSMICSSLTCLYSMLMMVIEWVRRNVKKDTGIGDEWNGLDIGVLLLHSIARSILFGGTRKMERKIASKQKQKGICGILAGEIVSILGYSNFIRLNNQFKINKFLFTKIKAHDNVKLKQKTKKKKQIKWLFCVFNSSL